jgi:1,6-anhydro-N-acetylmuramate kinase
MDKDVKADTLRIIVENKSTPQELCELNFRLGQMFADGIERFIKDQNLDLDRDIDVISCHGQTIWFQPQPKPGEVKSTLQMCESTVLAQRFGKTVVTDFRPAEQMAGRQGAPIACFQDALALIHPTLNRASQNIGGIANVAFVPAENAGECC